MENWGKYNEFVNKAIDFQMFKYMQEKILSKGLIITKVTQAGLGIETGVLGQSRREMLSAKSIW